MKTHTTLYRLYAADGRLLYVGVAGNPGRRFEQHAIDKPWWSEVATVTLEHHDDRFAALDAERAAITSEKPEHNIVHNRGKRPRPMQRGTMTERDDRLTAAAEKPLEPHSLIGSWFHSKEDDGSVKWQGCVVAEPHPGYYLVELFSWFMGDSTEQRLVRIEDMVTWDFYDSDQWMRNSYRGPGASSDEDDD